MVISAEIGFFRCICIPFSMTSETNEIAKKGISQVTINIINFRSIIQFRMDAMLKKG